MAKTTDPKRPTKKSPSNLIVEIYKLHKLRFIKKVKLSGSTKQTDKKIYKILRSVLVVKNIAAFTLIG